MYNVKIYRGDFLVSFNGDENAKTHIDKWYRDNPHIVDIPRPETKIRKRRGRPKKTI